MSVALNLALALALPGAASPQAAPAKQGKAPGKAGGKAPAKAPAPLLPLTDEERALHALNRLTFGPRPGDVEKVMAMGVDKWIEQQLSPGDIENSALDARLAPSRALRMTSRELVDTFPYDGIIRAVSDGKKPWPKNPLVKLVYSVQVARVREEKQKQDALKPGAPAPAPSAKSPQDEAREIADRILALPKGQRMAALEQVPPEKLINFPNQVRGDQRDKFNAEFTPEERETFYALNNPTGVIVGELQQAKVWRAVLSERQLEEVMTDFWINHFNVFLYKGSIPYYLPGYERDAIRPHALGKFQDLLTATAHSPAMLVYLDNMLSEGPDSDAAKRPGPYHGLNENYAREIMELHTLGVDGGYTQGDVIELARALTGWGIAQPEQGGEFQFDPKRHQPGSKTILGQTIDPGGEDEGLAILYILAHHSSTAHFVSKKLAQRFLADDPPEALVKQMAATFTKTDGNIREVLRTLVRSPDFWSPKYHRGKLKTPLEFLISAIRASGTEMVSPDPILQNLNAMGMPLYQKPEPTGYSMKAELWENTGALVNRLNFATSLTGGKMGGLRFDPLLLVTLAVLRSYDLPRMKAVRAKKQSGEDLALALIEDAVLGGELSPATVATIRRQLDDPAVAKQLADAPAAVLRIVTALVLGSPEFQRR
jgi:uncharacterized protein (DUF1800 family)